MPESLEPSVDELLADPIIRALMAADGVNVEKLRALLRSTAESLRRAERNSPRPAT